jgi:hypothetical protein
MLFETDLKLPVDTIFTAGTEISTIITKLTDETLLGDRSVPSWLSEATKQSDAAIAKAGGDVIGDRSARRRLQPSRGSAASSARSRPGAWSRTRCNGWAPSRLSVGLIEESAKLVVTLVILPCSRRLRSIPGRRAGDRHGVGDGLRDPGAGHIPWTYRGRAIPPDHDHLSGVGPGVLFTGLDPITSPTWWEVAIFTAEQDDLGESTPISIRRRRRDGVPLGR